MQRQEFKIGQRVKLWDLQDSCYVYGHVIEIKDNCVSVQWNDLLTPADHIFGDRETDAIKLGIPEL